MKRVSSKRAKALSISKAVKDRVWERDGRRCIICGSSQANPECHYIARSRGGLGIEENIFTGCRSCHREYDFGTAPQRAAIKTTAEAYLKSCYSDWDESQLIYRK